MRRCHTRSCRPWRVLPEAGHSNTSLYVTGLLMICGAVFLHRSDAFLAAMLHHSHLHEVGSARSSTAWPAVNYVGLKSLEFSRMLKP